ncbi:MAG: hypothetical protein ACPGTP_02100 [Bacteroidia bacterium]
MKQEFIASIEIDMEGRLHLTTASTSFHLIYRTASEIQWGPEKHSLYSPKPIDWTYNMWFLKDYPTIS